MALIVTVCLIDVPVVERHTREVLAQKLARGVEDQNSYPTPERYEESKPREKEHTTVYVNGIESRDGASFPIDRIDHGGLP